MCPANAMDEQTRATQPQGCVLTVATIQQEKSVKFVLSHSSGLPWNIPADVSNLRKLSQKVFLTLCFTRTSVCNCTSDGATGDCDPTTGRCYCKQNVEGIGCSRCMENTYGYGEDGCLFCNCSSSGSLSESCNQVSTYECICTKIGTSQILNAAKQSNLPSWFPHLKFQVSGQCSCRKLVIGTACDQCTPTYYNVNPITGCDREFIHSSISIDSITLPSVFHSFLCSMQLCASWHF